MSDPAKTVVVKKYANRRLYNTGTSSYVTLEDLSQMVRAGDDFLVKDAKTGEDITRNVLTQIIFEAENKGQHLLPISFLRELIRFYGDSMQTLVPTFLDQSMLLFARDRDKFRKHLAGPFGATGFDVVEEQVRRNMEMFQKSMRMFIPFAGADAAGRAPAGAEPRDETPSSPELAELREQVREMQARINHLIDVGIVSGAPVARAEPEAPAVDARKPEAPAVDARKPGGKPLPAASKAAAAQKPTEQGTAGEAPPAADASDDDVKSGTGAA